MKIITNSGAIETCHVAHSSSIATVAAWCPFAMRLKLVIGADEPRGASDRIGGFLHRVLAQTLVEYAIPCWETPEKLLHTSLRKFEEEIEQTGSHPSQEDIEKALNRLRGICHVFRRDVMEREPIPHTVWTEITILDPDYNHEGRLDAIIEWQDPKRALVIEWKGYVDDKSVDDYDRYQLLSNMLLEAYRLGFRDRQKALLKERVIGEVITPGGGYRPRATDSAINKVALARNWLVKIQVPGIPREERRIPPELYPSDMRFICPTCKLQEPCKFYKHEKEKGADFVNHFPDPKFTWNQVRRRAWESRYAVLRHREVSRSFEFKAREIEKSEPNPKEALREAGIIDYDYRCTGLENGCIIVLERGNINLFPPFHRGLPVKLIIDEPHIESLLAKFHLRGSVADRTPCNGGWRIKVRTWEKNNAKLLVSLLHRYPCILMRTEVDLTRRELQGIDFFHRIIASKKELQPLWKLAGIPYQEGDGIGM